MLLVERISFSRCLFGHRNFYLFDDMGGAGGPKSCFARRRIPLRKFYVKILDLSDAL
jgi:hypothetical protein